MSFSCPHYDINTDRCDRVRDECICGRPGCVLAHNSVFAVDPSTRLAGSRSRADEPSPETFRPTQNTRR